MTAHIEQAERYQVWYIPQVPMPAFERVYDDLETAKTVLNAIIDFSIFEFENRVKPDYADAAGIAVWEDGDWCDIEEQEWRDDQ